MLQLAINGQSDYDVETLRTATQYDSALEDKPELIKWFWETVGSMTPEDRSLLLVFVTGSSSIPTEGVGAIKFTVVLYSRGSSSSLPVSHTCFNILELPPYESREQLSERLVYAIRNTSVGQFGMM